MRNQGQTQQLRISRNQAKASSAHSATASAARQLAQELGQIRGQLEESRLQTDAMLNSLGEGLLVTDEHGQITMVNSYALSALGYKADELIGQWFPSKIISVDQTGQPVSELARPVIRALTMGQTVSDYLNYLKQDGSMMPVFVTVSPILRDNRPVGAVEVFRDLTKERELDIAKDEFVSLASHQLRTPATGVMMILSMLRAGDFGELTPVQQRYLDKAIDNNNRQLAIIEDLLNAARIDAGKMPLELEYADLAEVVQSSVNDHQSTVQGRDQTIELERPESCMLLLDAPKMRMVIDNLISNASKYSRAHTTIRVELAHRGRYAVLSVSDQGVGIAADDIPKLFTKFTRLDNALSSAVGGTGLGLFLAKNIIELHHGVIGVSAQPDVGSTFTVQLPIQQEEAA